jgi:cell division septation protein DedD
MLRPTLLACGLLMGSLTLPATGAAQANAVVPTAVASPVPVADSTPSAPVLTTARPAGLTRQQDAAPLPAPKVRRESNRTNTALMVTGLAAVLVGALVDDNDAGSVLIVGGAVVGLIGLYRFLQ